MNLNWYKSYDTKYKNAKKAEEASMFFVQNSKKKDIKVFLFCIITFEPIITKTCEAPQNDRQNLSYVTDKCI